MKDLDATGAAPAFRRSDEGKVVGFGTDAFHVALIPVATARAIIVARHYSRRFVNNTIFNFGLFVGGELLGVLQFGWPINPKGSLRIVRVADYRALLELNRMWVDDACPRNTESRAIAYCLRAIARLRPGVVAVQSFADSRCGLNGVVYQAAGFRYFGSHVTEFFELDGETYHKMLLSTLRTHPNNRGRHLKDNLHRATKNRFRQHRYIYFMRGRFHRLALLREYPFPKVSRPADGADG